VIHRKIRLGRAVRHVGADLLPVFAFFLFFQRLPTEGIATTGLRG
jgi:hypothetical protein